MKLKLFKMMCFVISVLLVAYASAEQHVNIYKATIMEAEPVTPEISTEELQKILEQKSAKVLDARSFKEYAIGHIPGAVTVSAEPGVSKALYVSNIAEIGRIVKGNKAAAIVLYCNGPFCNKIRRVAKKLKAEGYTNVRRYQLGIPVWRALGGVTVSEIEGIQYILNDDKTAVLIDARDSEEFKVDSITNARNIPHNRVKKGKDVGEIKKAKNDGRLPVQDRNARIIVYGKNGAQARAVAEALAKEAFHNTSYFDGTFMTLKKALK